MLDTPTCSEPSAILNGYFLPARRVYSHLDQVSYYCHDKLSLKTEDSRLTCVRTVDNEGHVRGEWNLPAPSCIVSSIITVCTIKSVLSDSGSEKLTMSAADHHRLPHRQSDCAVLSLCGLFSDAAKQIGLCGTQYWTGQGRNCGHNDWSLSRGDDSAH